MANEVLKQWLADAEARREAIVFSEEEREEVELRARIAAVEAETAKAEKARRMLEMSRRIAACKEAHPGVDVRGLAIERTKDIFIIRWDDDVYRGWTKQPETNDDEKEKARVDLAVGCIVDWNGITDFGASGDNENGHKLREYLRSFVDVRNRVTAMILGEMSAANAEARKS